MADKYKKPEWFKGSETEWNRKSQAEQWRLINEAGKQSVKETSNNMNKGFDAAAGALQRLLVHQSESYNIAKDWATLMTNGNERMNIAIQFTADALKDEAKIRETITIEMGLAGALQEQQQEEIIDSAAAAARYGITLDTVLQTMKAMSETLERNIILDDEQITNMNLLAKATGLGSYEIAKLVEGFDTIGVGISGAIKQGEEMANVARKMGLNVNTFMSTMADNIKQVNAYNYKDGVQGFTRMAAQAQRLRIDMSTATNLATELFEPEKAIELAANMQVLGGAVGALADPFELMYMATNDVEGLQNAITDAAAASVMFNEETGQFDISATEMRRLKEMAGELGMSYEELANTAVKARTEQMAMSQLDMSGIDEDLKGFVAGIAQIGDGGRFEVQLGETPLGDPIVKRLEDLSTDDVQRLQQMQEDQAKTSKEIAVESMNALDLIAGAIKGAHMQVLVGNASTVGKSLATEFGDPVSQYIESFGANMEQFTGLMGEAMATGETSGLNEFLSQHAINIAGLVDKIGNTGTADFLTQFLDTSQPMQVDNYQGLGKTILINNDGTYETSPNDFIDVRKQEEVRQNFSEISNITNNNTNTPTIPQTVRLDLSGRINIGGVTDLDARKIFSDERSRLALMDLIRSSVVGGPKGQTESNESYLG